MTTTSEDSGRCPIYNDELPEIYKDEKGWFWRVDYAGGGPFGIEKRARAAAAKFLSTCPDNPDKPSTVRDLIAKIEKKGLDIYVEVQFYDADGEHDMIWVKAVKTSLVGNLRRLGLDNPSPFEVEGHSISSQRLQFILK